MLEIKLNLEQLGTKRKFKRNFFRLKYVSVGVCKTNLRSICKNKKGIFDKILRIITCVGFWVNIMKNYRTRN